MKRFLLLLMFVASTLLYAEDSSIQKSYYEDGTLKESFEPFSSLKGNALGEFKKFYPSGTLKSVVPIIESTGELGYAAHGKVKIYYENQKLKRLQEFDRGVRSGECKLYYEDGSVQEESTFSDEISEISKRYDRSGKPLPKVQFIKVDPRIYNLDATSSLKVYIDNYYDKRADLGWLLAYKKEGSNWERIFKRHISSLPSRDSVIVEIANDELPKGTLRFGVTYFIPGVDKYADYKEVHSATIKIEQGGAINAEAAASPR